MEWPGESARLQLTVNSQATKEDFSRMSGSFDKEEPASIMIMMIMIIVNVHKHIFVKHRPK